MKLALEVFAAVGVLLIAICVVYNVRQSRRPDNEQIAWQTIPLFPQAKPAPPAANRRGAAVPLRRNPPWPPARAASNSSPGGAVSRRAAGGPGRRDAAPVPIAVALGKCPVAQPRRFTRFAGSTSPPATASVSSFSNGVNDRAPPPLRLGKTAAKKPEGPIYLDDLQELSSGVAIGILGKHGETGYPEFDSEYGPKVILPGKEAGTLRSRRIRPARAPAMFLTFSKASTALCGRWRRSWR